MTTISQNEIYQALATNQVSEVKLKDGTVMKVKNGKSLQLNNILNSSNYNQNLKNKERHNHHKDGIGSFGQHFKTEYSRICPDCVEGPGGIIKKRQNYVLYVSKNVTEENISKKNKCKNPKKQQDKILLAPKKKKILPQKLGNKGKIISHGYVEYNGMPEDISSCSLQYQLGKQKWYCHL